MFNVFSFFESSNSLRSILSKYVLNPFWTWFVTLWPLSVAPNTVCLSFLFKLLLILECYRSHFLDFLSLYSTLWHSYTTTQIIWRKKTELRFLSGSISRMYLVELGVQTNNTWIVGVSACSCIKVSMQSMGSWHFLSLLFPITHSCSKQARRTGMAGPLGEMFDHGMCIEIWAESVLMFYLGCDAMNTTVSLSSMRIRSTLIILVHPARSYNRCPSTQSWSLLVDFCVPSRYIGEFLFNDLGRISYWWALKWTSPATQ